MKFLVLILFSATQISAGGPLGTLPPPTCDNQNSKGRGECFQENSVMTSCNGEWIGSYTNGNIRLYQVSTGIWRQFLWSPCPISACIDENGKITVEACGFQLYEFDGVEKAVLGDDGSMTLYDINMNILWTRPFDHWDIVQP